MGFWLPYYDQTSVACAREGSPWVLQLSWSIVWLRWQCTRHRNQGETLPAITWVVLQGDGKNIWLSVKSWVLMAPLPVTSWQMVSVPSTVRQRPNHPFHLKESLFCCAFIFSCIGCDCWFGFFLCAAKQASYMCAFIFQLMTILTESWFTHRWISIALYIWFP